MAPIRDVARWEETAPCCTRRLFSYGVYFGGGVECNVDRARIFGPVVNLALARAVEREIAGDVGSNTRLDWVM